MPVGAAGGEDHGGGGEDQEGRLFRPLALTKTFAMAAAAAGEILVSADAADAAGLDASDEPRTLTLRGRTEPLDVRVLHV